VEPSARFKEILSAALFICDVNINISSFGKVLVSLSTSSAISIATCQISNFSNLKAIKYDESTVDNRLYRLHYHAPSSVGCTTLSSNARSPQLLSEYFPLDQCFRFRLSRNYFRCVCPFALLLYKFLALW
jgi:hypothetical protein